MAIDNTRNRLRNCSLNPPSLLQFPILALPAELRNKIYRYAVSWPIMPFQEIAIAMEQKLLKQGFEVHSTCPSPIIEPRFGRKFTPSLLLVNRQTSSEALSVLYQSPLIINSPLLRHLQLVSANIQTIISEMTLKRLRFVVLDMELTYKSGLPCSDAKEWLKTFEYLSNIWQIECALQEVVVKVRYKEPSKRLGWTFSQAGTHSQVMAILEILKRLGEQINVVFEGETPGPSPC